MQGVTHAKYSKNISALPGGSGCRVGRVGQLLPVGGGVLAGLHGQIKWVAPANNRLGTIMGYACTRANSLTE